MKQDITLNETVKEAVTTALLHMMRNKSIDSIQIKDLVKVAGVSRSSFYRNFESKEDVLVKYLNKIYYDYFHNENIPAKYEDFNCKRDLYVARLSFIKQNKDFFTVLNKNGIVDKIFREIDENNACHLFSLHESDGAERRYKMALDLGASSGVIVEWINRKFVDDVEDLATFLENALA